MKTSIALPIIAAALLGLAGCTKHSETENVTVNETSTNVAATDLNAVDANAVETNAIDGNAAGVDGSANAGDALTNQ